MKEFRDVVTDAAGNASDGKKVEIRIAATGIKATLYATADPLGSEKANPLTSAGGGIVSFFAQDNDYVAVVRPDEADEREYPFQHYDLKAMRSDITALQTLTGADFDLSAIVDVVDDLSALAPHANAIATVSTISLSVQAVAANEENVSLVAANMTALLLVNGQAAQVALDAGQVNTDKVAVAADKGTVAADKALTLGYRNEAEGFKDDAESAAIASAAAGKKYTTTGDGIADTVDGEYFVTPVSGGLAIWKNVAEVATAWPAAGAGQKVIATSEALAGAVADVASAASTVGTDLLNAASRGSIGGIDPADELTLRAVLWASAPGKSIIANEFETALHAQYRTTADGVGDSRMQGSGVVSAGAAVNPRSGIAGSFPRHLEYRLQQRNPAWRVINRGQTGQKSNEAAARSAALPILITLTTGTTLPSAGATPCRAGPGHPTTSNGPSALRNNSPDVYAGTIGSQACLLKAVDNNSSGPKQYTIEQVGGTGDLTVNPGTIFRLADSSLNHAVKIFWAGVNDPIDLYTVGDGLGLQMSKEAARAVVDALPEGDRRYVMIGDTAFCGGTMDAGSATHDKMLALNAWKREQFGWNFFDFHRWQRGEAPYDGSMFPSYFQMANVSPTDPIHDWVTPGDWRTLGRPPRSLVSIFLGGGDLNHPHENTYGWAATAVDEFHFKAKGWQP